MVAIGCILCTAVCIEQTVPTPGGELEVEPSSLIGAIAASRRIKCSRELFHGGGSMVPAFMASRNFLSPIPGHVDISNRLYRGCVK
jgi:hypothetical protein